MKSVWERKPGEKGALTIAAISPDMGPIGT